MFTPDAIYERRHRRPFVPMRIFTGSGEHYDVRHPEMLMVGKHLIVIGIPSTDDPIIYEKTSQLSILEITGIEDLPKAPSNGYQ